MDSAQQWSPELLFAIFEHLSPEDVLAARCACRLWDAVAVHIIARRAARGGPLITLNGTEHVPVSCCLPLFAQFTAQAALHPAIVQYHTNFEQGPLFGRKFLAKLAVLAIDYHQPWSAEQLNSSAMPRLRCLSMGSKSSRAVLVPGSLPTVTSALVCESSLPRTLPAATPACTALHVRHTSSPDTLHEYVGQWPRLDSVRLFRCKCELARLPRDLRELALVYCHMVLNTPSHDANAAARRQSLTLEHRGPELMQALLVCDDVDVRRACFLELPQLTMLEIDDTSVPQVLIVPNLRSLHVKHTYPNCVDVRRLPCLEHLTLANIAPHVDLRWLPAGLRRLDLDWVEIFDLDFLRHVPALESLILNMLLADSACRMPCEHLQRLKTLTIVDWNILEPRRLIIDNIPDIATLARLETLSLKNLSVADVSWISRLGSLRSLALKGLDNVVAVDVVCRAPSLERLSVSALTSLRILCIPDPCAASS